MLTLPVLTLVMAMTPALVSAGIFPRDSLVKMLDPKGFKREVLNVNQTTMVAFVAPWCGHCQRMAPEYSKAALGLHPLIPTYAVNCDAEKNKRLCSEQGVRGFPTVKLFPRGKTVPPMTYDSGERTASAFFYWASRRVPNTVTKLYNVDDIEPWVRKTQDNGKHRVLLLTKDKKVPLLWKVLGNKYQGQLELASHRDRKGKSSVALGYEAGEKKEAKVIVYPQGTTGAVRYQGINKLDSLSKFFDSLLDGTADLQILNEQASSEEYAPTEEELDIERKQEAQRIALAHGGFADLVDFEKAIKEGAGANYHDVHGYGGAMGDIPSKFKKEGAKAEGEGETVKPAPAPESESDQVVFQAKRDMEASCSGESSEQAAGECSSPDNHDEL
ncbi:hypothetical protein AX16_005899 [Volvariella volvacea WC 439]|nr:hypothetical protein AX16_005899 [Volvariella volvacea WC 439]